MSRAVQPNEPNLQIAIRTLACVGFLVERVERKPHYATILARRVDEFGSSHASFFAISQDRFAAAEADAIAAAATQHRAEPVYVGVRSGPHLTWDHFLALLGGPILTTNPLDPNFTNCLNQLGFNKLPVGLVGAADDLFEAYVRDALQFILGVRVIRYGQNRRFEARPDGIVLPDDRLCALYDAKAYSDGYNVTLDSIRQFASYVEDFRQRYHEFLKRVDVFLVISGTFPHKQSTLDKRSRDLLSACGTPLSFLKASALSEIVELLKTEIPTRRAINWKRIFLETAVTAARVREEIESIKHDGIVK